MNQAIQALKSENKMTDEIIQKFTRLKFPCVYITWDDGREHQRDLIDYDEALQLMHLNKLDIQEYVGLVLELRPMLDREELTEFIQHELKLMRR